MLPLALTYFREVALSGSIRRAAEHLSIAPSAISRQIGQLEAELQVALFDRRARRLTLTAAGELVRDYAARASTDADALRASLQQITGLQAGQVRIGSVEGMVYFLSRYLAGFDERFPGIRVSVSIVGSRAVLELLRDGEIDLALAFGLPARNPFHVHARLEQPLCAIVAAGHPLAARRSISFKTLADQRVVLPDTTFQIRSLIDAIALKTKTSLTHVIEANTLDMAKGIVRHSELMTFLPRYAALREIASGELCAVPLQERDLAQTHISLITMPSYQPSPAARKLLQTFKAGMGRYGTTTAAERG
ncbi:LysR family transcriptional regulator [Variovorax boronicumulans]